MASLKAITRSDIVFLKNLSGKCITSVNVTPTQQTGFSFKKGKALLYFRFSMKNFPKNAIHTLVFLLITCSTAIADTLTVGIKEAPPFTIKNGENWEGLAITLWENYAAKDSIHFEYVELGMDELNKGLKNQELDAALGAITVSAKREADFDFSRSFYPSGLGVMFKKRSGTAIKVIYNIFSGSFFQVVALLCLVLFVVGFIIWLAERHKNPEEFEGGIKGLFSGFWWSAVTMTTVGYGDKSPKTGAGKMVGLIWMFASLIMISYFTASIASALTVSKIGDNIQSPSDLKNITVGVVKGTISESYLSNHRIDYSTANSFDELVAQLENKEIDALLSDYPLIKYYMNKNKKSDFRMLPHKLNEFFYAVGISDKFQNEELLNQTILEHIESDQWQDELYNYFGDSE
jgi:ABC-type amino acid transport substrate-binding protein